MNGAAHCSFRTALYNSYFGKVLLMKFATINHNLLKHCISANFLLVESYVQGALQKELRIAPFGERIKTVTMGRSC